MELGQPVKAAVFNTSMVLDQQLNKQLFSSPDQSKARFIALTAQSHNQNIRSGKYPAYIHGRVSQVQREMY